MSGERVDGALDGGGRCGPKTMVGLRRDWWGLWDLWDVKEVPELYEIELGESKDNALPAFAREDEEETNSEGSGSGLRFASWSGGSTPVLESCRGPLAVGTKLDGANPVAGLNAGVNPDPVGLLQGPHSIEKVLALVLA